MPAAAPWWSGVETAVAFMAGAAVPVTITYFAPVAIETWAILIAVVISLALTSLVASGLGRLSHCGCWRAASSSASARWA